MITTRNSSFGFDQAFSRAVQIYSENVRSQCQAIILPPEEIIRASWKKMSKRLSKEVASASEVLV